MNSKLEDKKAKLQEQSEKIEDSLSEEFSIFSDKAADLAGKILIIGGGALFSYLIVKMILGKDKKVKKNGEGIRERVIVQASSPKYIFFRSLSDKAALVLLELAREMVVRYLKELPSKNEN
ncbi:MAG: hypothetical protein KFF73_03545 [Cyclobacteriaceae bacterium]|nr:hypothetical protein [Cyclobacteriaceae bacterium]